MGADLIGYLVKGPRKISEAKWRKAEKEMLQRMELMWTTHKLICPDCGKEIDITDPDAVDWGCPHCDSDAPRVLMDIDDREAFDSFMKDMKKWPPQCRDTAMRGDPDDDKQVLLFAGEMSWGDEPCGYGFDYLKKLTRSGLGELVGVR